MKGALPVSAARARIPPRRLWIAVVVCLIVLGLTVAAALATGARVGGPVLFVERVSSAISSFIRRAGSDLRLAYAFLAGVVAAFNPCGFALLPAYLGVYLGDPISGKSRLGRALAVSSAVSLSFIGVFGLIGIVVGIASQAVVTVMPWIGLGVGLILIASGGLALAGRFPGATWGQRLADHAGKTAAGTGLTSYGAFGIGYAFASLSCTLPIFLAVVGSTFATDGGFEDAALQFVLFGAGMASVLAVLTVVVSAFKGAVLRQTRNVSRYVAPASTVLLLAAGAYLIYYWLTIGRLLLA